MIILGDSHTAAIMQAAIEVDPEIKVGMLTGAAKLLSPFHEATPHLKFLDKDITHQHERIVGGPIGSAGAFVFSAGLTSNVFLGPLARQRFSLTVNRSSICIMSSAMFEEMIAETQAPIIRFYEDLLSLDLLKAVIAGPPPQEHHIASTFFGPKLFDMIRAHQAPVRAALAGRCPIIEVENVSDTRGYLLPKYQSSDPSHGNSAYGALVIKALQQTLS